MRAGRVLRWTSAFNLDHSSASILSAPDSIGARQSERYRCMYGYVYAMLCSQSHANKRCDSVATRQCKVDGQIRKRKEAECHSATERNGPGTFENLHCPIANCGKRMRTRRHAAVSKRASVSRCNNIGSCAKSIGSQHGSCPGLSTQNC